MLVEIADTVCVCHLVLFEELGKQREMFFNQSDIVFVEIAGFVLVENPKVWTVDLLDIIEMIIVSWENSCGSHVVIVVP